MNNNNISVLKLIEACDYVGRHSIKICGGYHGSSYLFDKLMRYFEKEHSAVSVTIPVILNSPLCGAKAEATISRTGDAKISLIKAD